MAGPVSVAKRAGWRWGSARASTIAQPKESVRWAIVIAGSKSSGRRSCGSKRVPAADEHDIELRLGRTALDINASLREVALDDGEQLRDDLTSVTTELEREGVHAFWDSYRDLLDCIETKLQATVDHAARLAERR
jgi:hypothetical protein